MLAWQDLEDARTCVNRLLGLNREVPPPQEDATIRGALVTAAIVAYGRMFSPTRSRGQVPGSLPASFTRALSPDLRQLHRRVLGLRSKEFAHADADVADIVVEACPDYLQGILLSESRRLRTFSVSDADLRGLNSLLTHVHIYLHDEMLRLFPLLARHGDF